MPEEKTGAQNLMWWVAPYFVVDDVVATASFYRDKLGFFYERFWGDPPRFAMVRRQGATIMLRQVDTSGHMRPNRTPNPNDCVLDAYFWIDDADKLCEQFQANGVKIVSPICDREYDMREFDIEDCNGFRLCFGHNTLSR
ncbi:MAG: VOC family protein [Candidatus Sulfotelmatobacter sp.]